MYDMSCDIWSVGCVLFTLLTGSSVLAPAQPTGSPPVSAAASPTRSLSQQRMLREDFNDVISELSEPAQDVLRRCLSQQPWKRPTAAELLHHPYIKAGDGYDASTLLFGAAARTPSRRDSPRHRRSIPSPTPPPVLSRSFPPAVSPASSPRVLDLAHPVSVSVPPVVTASSHVAQRRTTDPLSESIPSSVSTGPPAVAVESTTPSRRVIITTSPPPAVPMTVTSSRALDEELNRISAERASVERAAKAKARELKRAFLAGSGQDGDAGANAVLGRYRPLPNPAVPAALPEDSASAVLNASMRSDFSTLSDITASLPSVITFMSPSGAGRSRRRRHKPRHASHNRDITDALHWSGIELSYWFGHVTPKAALCVYGNVVIAACVTSGMALVVRADMPTKAWCGVLTEPSSSYDAFCDVCASVGKLSKLEWLERVKRVCGVDCSETTSSVAFLSLCKHVTWQEPVLFTALRPKQRQLFRFVTKIMHALSSCTVKVSCGEM